MKRLARLLVTVIVTVSVTLGFVAPAHAAGTLTGLNFTAPAPYTVTGATNTRYDYGFTAASSGTVSRVSASVPAGTKASGTRYLRTNGATIGNYASTNDNAQNRLVGDFDIRTLTYSTNPNAGDQTFLGKFDPDGGANYWLGLTGGVLRLYLSSNGSGSSYYFRDATVKPSFQNQAGTWLRATFRPNDGSGNNVATFYTSTDGTSWTGLGTPVVVLGIAPLGASSAVVQVGENYGRNQLLGRSYFASVASGINGTTTSPTSCTSTGVVACFNPGDYAGGTSFTSSSPQAETWTVYRAGANLPADIASDLQVSGVSGLPTGGAASYRYIDNLAVYQLPSATSVGAGVPCTISLQDFTNPTTAGSYSSTLTTYDNAGTPTPIDTGTTPVLAFTASAGGAVVGVAVDPTFTFTLAGLSAACNGLANSNGANATGSSVPLGRLTTGARGSSAQTLTVGTNSSLGFVVKLRSTSATSPVLAGQNFPSNHIADTTSGALPSASAEAFGFTTGDSGVAMTSGNVAPLPVVSSSTSAIIAAAGVQSRTSCVGYFASVASTTPADTYVATVVYSAIPTF